MVLAIPAMISQTTPEVVLHALEAVPVENVRTWTVSHLLKGAGFAQVGWLRGENWVVTARKRSS